VREYLQGSGVPRVADIRNPAGLDLGARTAPEVALSILAEIVQLAPSARARTDEPTSVEPTNPRTAIDPVCGMEVEIATARHSAQMDGVTYYFCCPHCRAHFLKAPQSYLSPQP
jgi:xanthine dehydrogenase accessory factor